MVARSISVLLVQFVLVADVSACFTGREQDAWLTLPAHEAVLGQEKDEFVNYGTKGTQVILKLRVDPSEFMRWSQKCQFDFEGDEDLKEFHWDSQTFMGYVTYNDRINVLRIQVIKYRN